MHRLQQALEQGEQLGRADPVPHGACGPGPGEQHVQRAVQLGPGHRDGRLPDPAERVGQVPLDDASSAIRPSNASNAAPGSAASAPARASATSSRTRATVTASNSASFVGKWR